MNLRRVRYVLLFYVLCDLLAGYAGIIPLTECAAAQFTTVSGTVVDPNGIPYSFGTITPLLVIPSGAGSPTLNGQSYFPPSQASSLDMTGHFIVQLADNTVLLPAATKWNFMVCSGAGSVPPAFGKGPVCFSLAVPITISGNSQDISANLNAVALALTLAAGCAQGTCVVNAPTTNQTITGAHGLLLSDPASFIGIGTATVTANTQFEIHETQNLTLPLLGSFFAHVTGLGVPAGTSNTAGPVMNLNFSRGTQGTPTAVQGNSVGGDTLGEYAFSGFDGTSYILGSSSIQSLVLENWTSTHHGSSLQIFTTFIGTNASQEVFRFGLNPSVGGNENFTNLDLAISSQKVLCWGTSGGGSGCDSAWSRHGVNILRAGNGTFDDSTGTLQAAGLMSLGTTFSASGCTNSARVGGATAGQFTVGQNTACTIVITMGNSLTAPNGWTCSAYDETAVPAVAIRQTAHSATSCSLLMTVATNDIIVFAAAPGW